MSVTTGNDITITTGTVTRQFGTFSLQIDMPSLSSKTTTMKLSKMPTIKQDFDVQYEFDDLSELRVNLSEIEIEVFDKLANGDSLFSLISDLAVTEAITIQSTVNTGGGDGTDYFYATRQNCEYDWRKRMVTIKAKAALRYDVEVTDYAAIASSEIFTATFDGVSDFQSLLSGDIIDSFLSSQGSNPTVFSYSAFFDDYYDDINGSGSTTTKFLGNFAEDNAFTVDNSTYAGAQDTILRMSIIDGAVIGSMLGYSFYVPRSLTAESTIDGQSPFSTITASQIKDYKIDNHELNVFQYISRFGLYNASSASNKITDISTTTATVNELGAKNVNLEYLMRSEVFGYDGVDWEVNNSANIDTKLTADNSSIATSTRESYALALGIADPSTEADVKYAVEIDILGIGNLLPFQYVKFGTDIHPALDNKKFRPTTLEYDLEKNIIKTRAYPI